MGIRFRQTLPRFISNTDASVISGSPCFAPGARFKDPAGTACEILSGICRCPSYAELAIKITLQESRWAGLLRVMAGWTCLRRHLRRATNEDGMPTSNLISCRFSNSSWQNTAFALKVQKRRKWRVLAVVSVDFRNQGGLWASSAIMPDSARSETKDTLWIA
jgi:hypothetical protein